MHKIYYEIAPQFDIAIVKVFQLPGDSVPQTHYWGSAVDHTVCRATFQIGPVPMTVSAVTCRHITATAAVTAELGKCSLTSLMT